MQPRVAGQCELGGRAREPSSDPLLIGVLHGDPQLGGGLGFGLGVDLVGPDQLCVEHAELTAPAECLLERPDGQRRFLFDLEPGQDEGHRVAPPAEQVDRDLQVARCGPARRPRDAHPVLGNFFEVDRVEAGDDVGVRVLGPGDLVEQLRGHRADRDRSAGARMLGDHRRTVCRDLGDGETGVFEIGNLGEEGVIATGRLCAALDHVTGDDRAGQPVPVARLPPVVPGRRPDDERRVGHPRADHHVGPAAEGLDDRPAAEIRVGRHHLTGGGGQRLAGVEMVEMLTGLSQLADAGEEVVAFDVGDRHRDTQPVRQLTDLVGEAARVETARVGHHLDPAVDAGAEHLFHLGEERACPPCRRVALAPLPKDEHGELGQPVTGQDVDRSVFHHLPRRGQAVAEESRAIGDPQRLAHRPSPPSPPPWSAASTIARTRPVSTWSPSATSTDTTVPAAAAWTACSIFIASRTTRTWPASTTSPGATATRTTPPGIGARAEPAAACSAPAGSRSCSTRVELPSGPST